MLTCDYQVDESACAGGSAYVWSIPVHYFGAGSTKLPLPAATAAQAKTKCAAAKGPKKALGGVAEHAKALIGSWAVCVSPHPGESLDADGVTFNPDGSLQVLTTDASGHFVPLGGCNRQGLWGFWPEGSSGQLQLFFDLGTQITMTTFTAGSTEFVPFDGYVLVRTE